MSWGWLVRIEIEIDFEKGRRNSVFFFNSIIRQNKSAFSLFVFSGHNVPFFSIQLLDEDTSASSFFVLSVESINGPRALFFKAFVSFLVNRFEGGR